MLTALGDAVHVLPLVSAIKRQLPATHITWILQPPAAALVRNHPAVDELIVFDRHRGVRGFLETRGVLRARRFDTVLLLQPYLKAAVLAALAPASRRIGTDRTRARDLSWLATRERLPPRPPGHMQDQFLEFLEPLGVRAEPLEWNLGPWAGEIDAQHEFFSRFERPVAALVIGTSKADKDWIPGRWAELADILTEDYGLAPVLVGGTSEREIAARQAVLERAVHPPVSALGSGIRPLVSILDGAALVISPDTGPLHMSVALGTPVISLIGYAHPGRTGPYRRFQDLMIDAFHDPDESTPISNERRHGRMPRIRLRDVVEKVEIWKKRYASRPKS